jgi:uncharacterized protein DUF6404
MEATPSTPMDRHRRRLARYMATAEARGVKPRLIAGPVLRGLWALGLPVPPPLAMNVVQLFLLMIGFVVLLWGLALGVMAFLPQELATRLHPVPSFWGVVSLLLFSLFNVAYLRRKARRLGLGTWDSYAAD